MGDEFPEQKCDFTAKGIQMFLNHMLNISEQLDAFSHLRLATHLIFFNIGPWQNSKCEILKTAKVRSFKPSKYKIYSRVFGLCFGKHLVSLFS